MNKLGKEFYSQQRDRWIARIPVHAYLQRANGSYYVKKGWLESVATSLGELTFSASMSEAEQRAEVARQVLAWLATKTEEFEGEKLLIEGSYDLQTYDSSRTLEYSREETRIVDGEAQVSAAIDRPLLHVKPWVFCEMYNVHSLAPEGFEAEGNCVAHQLELWCARMVSRSGPARISRSSWTKHRPSSMMENRTSTRTHRAS